MMMIRSSVSFRCSINILPLGDDLVFPGEYEKIDACFMFMAVHGVVSQYI